VHRRVMVCTGRVTSSGGMRGCLKTASRRTGSLFNLRSRRAARESSRIHRACSESILPR
jgi:hypothetical protein